MNYDEQKRQFDTIAEKRGDAENEYRKSFSHTIDFGKRKRSKFTLLAGGNKPEQTVCKNAPAPKRRRSNKQKNLIAGMNGQSIHALSAAARVERKMAALKAANRRQE